MAVVQDGAVSRAAYSCLGGWLQTDSFFGCYLNNYKNGVLFDSQDLTSSNQITHSEALSKRQAFSAVLLGAANTKEPLYRMSAKELAAEKDKLVSSSKNEKPYKYCSYALTMADESADAGFKAIKERLKKRDEKRLKELEKRRQEKLENRVETEQISYFQEAFSKQAREIEARFQEISSGKISKSMLPNYFYDLANDLSALEQFIAASTFYVRNYDVRKSTETIQTFQGRLRELQDKFLPRKKFAFQGVVTKKKKAVGEKIEDAVDSVVISGPPPKSKVLDYMNSSIGYSNRIAEVLTLTQGEVCKESVELTDLQDCTVKVFGTPSTLHLVSLKNCKVFCGPVTTSIFLDNCIDCTFIMACQQLRVHSASHCDFYIHVTSRAIIEDCSSMRFAPYNWKYDDLDKHFEVAGLDPNKNNWTMVEDFNWIISSYPSPNWRVMKDTAFPHAGYVHSTCDCPINRTPVLDWANLTCNSTINHVLTGVQQLATIATWLGKIILFTAKAVTWLPTLQRRMLLFNEPSTPFLQISKFHVLLQDGRIHSTR
ncbi:hypothetical protein PR048_001165 [Dryococelus australis]|uniref:C-CAP/cofactor C-like domain-containing protein n=1 Tax=Dryococelus australis TaxID=614101 RepID=A0ABQ9IGP3_9NEOP|nr:hypothetical protein PR048_001165 [Dryococelus australis]